MKILKGCAFFVLGTAVLTLSGRGNIKNSKEEIGNLINNYVKYSAVFFRILNDKKKSKMIENGDTSNLSKDELAATDKYLKLFAGQMFYESTTTKMIWFGNMVNYEIKNIKILGNKATAEVQVRARSALSFSDALDEYKFTFHLRKIVSKWRIQSIGAVNLSS